MIVRGLKQIFKLAPATTHVVLFVWCVVEMGCVFHFLSGESDHFQSCM